jgi:hypothetical protein
MDWATPGGELDHFLSQEDIDAFIYKYGFSRGNKSV